MQERRRFFRLDDEVIMEFRPLSADEFEQWRSEHQLQTSELKQLEQELGLLLHQVRASHPQLGQVLELFNRKINLLHNTHDHPGDTPELHNGSNEARMQVNLSACGIAFYTDEPLQAERFMLLNIQLKPSNASLSLAGDIVSVKEVNHDRGRYQVRVNFDGLKEAEQEMLIQHLFQLQSRTLRQQRAGD
ncbi:PilZ domain-containing protein [Venatoribacter cucullus]|uniref:PilZ domain-containing protein n=1 Tax=Venatoribacter cucullus TaxID=2661630 RepID=UPI001937BD19|nr:PilZ domain-containing protein [Venatoribacter cucullus]QQD20495.1 hypothetical protein GJQ54_01395 [Oceanospirillaceae bacterium ASx5O]UZK02631.1 hypothetical protein GAY96_01345 [Venatoribacter cucullus]